MSLSKKAYPKFLVLILGVVLLSTSGCLSLVQKSDEKISQSEPNIAENNSKPTADEILDKIVLTERNNPDFAQARMTLINYFDLLNSKNYTEAVKFHGSGYEILRDWNTNTDPNDYAALLKNGCENNGWQCLKNNLFRDFKILTPQVFTFVVELIDSDGNLFKYPCPFGEAMGNSCTERTEFEFTVVMVNDNFMVLTPPIYVP